MELLEKNTQMLKRLTWFFIFAGTIEVFIFIFVFGTLWLIIPGLITIIPAYISLSKDKIKWKYFIGIWALVKYNPIGFFVIQDLIRKFCFHIETTLLVKLINWCYLFVGISSSIIAVIIIVKTARQIKLIKLQKAVDEK